MSITKSVMLKCCEHSDAEPISFVMLSKEELQSLIKLINEFDADNKPVLLVPTITMKKQGCTYVLDKEQHDSQI